MRLTADEQMDWKPRCFRCGTHTKHHLRHDRPPSDTSLYCHMCAKKRNCIIAKHRQELASFDEWRTEQNEKQRSERLSEQTP